MIGIGEYKRFCEGTCRPTRQQQTVLVAGIRYATRHTSCYNPCSTAPTIDLRSNRGSHRQGGRRLIDAYILRDIITKSIYYRHGIITRSKIVENGTINFSPLL